MKKFLILLTSLVLLTAPGISGCSEPDGGGDDPADVSNLLYGIGEPFAGTHVKGFNVDTAADLVGALGAKSFRMWMEPADLFDGWNFSSVLSDETLSSVSEAGRLTYESYISALEAAGVEEITGQGVFFPKVPSTANGKDNTTVPERDVSAGSEYMRFLHKTELVWTAIARAFPEITVWEVGNEINHNPFLHRKGYLADGAADQDPAGNANTTTFSFAEKAAITADYMYYASKGVRAGNPEAVAITPGLAPVGGLENRNMEHFLAEIYRNIKSGEFPAGEVKSTDSSDYFRGLAWHPYYRHDARPDGNWKKLNDDIFAVAEKNGDGDLEVWFTEFGFTTLNPTDPLDETFETEQAGWYAEYFRMAEGMDYVRSIHLFRLFCCKADTGWGGPSEEFYGLFLEPDESLNRGFTPRKRAYALQSVYGGTGDLEKYSKLS